MKSKDSKKETQSLGTLGGLFGHPVTAVLRRLGKEVFQRHMSAPL